MCRKDNFLGKGTHFERCNLRLREAFKRKKTEIYWSFTNSEGEGACRGGVKIKIQ